MGHETWDLHTRTFVCKRTAGHQLKGREDSHRATRDGMSQSHPIDEGIDDGVDDDQAVEEIQLVEPRLAAVVLRLVDGIVEGEHVVGAPQDQVGQEDLERLADNLASGPESVAFPLPYVLS